MARMLITGLATEVANVVVFEPRQTPEQPEVKIDEFRLDPGETREYELSSATAAYRLEPVKGELPEGFWEPAPDQEPIYGRHPDTDAELQAGRERLQLAEDSRFKTQEEVARAPQRRAAEASGAKPMRDPNAAHGKSAEHKPADAGKKGQDKAAEAHKRNEERAAERAKEKTEGQKHDEGENPSPVTGSTGQSDAAAEQRTAAPTPEQVEANKATKR